MKGGLATLFRSPLVRTLLLLFLSLALVEAVFISVLCFDIVAADRAAMNELRIVKASQNVNNALLAARRFWNARIAGYKHPGNKLYADRYYELRRQFMQSQKLATKDLVEIGLDPKLVEDLERRLAQVNRVSEESLSVPDESRDVSELEYQNQAWLCAKAFLRIMRQIHEIKAIPVRLDKVIVVDPVQLLYTAAVAAAMLLIGIGIFIERSISKPVSRLYEDCERIKTGVALDKPELQRSEIGTLQKSFYTMSLMIAENDKRRRTYLEFLQTAQTEAMKRVREWMDSLVNSTLLSERAIKLVKRAEVSLASLILLIHSMTETLQDTDGKVTPHLIPGNTSQLLQEATSGVDALLRKRNITLKVTSDEFNVRMDPMLIVRVLINFLSNAIKYSPDSSEVTIAIVRENDILRCSVQDLGPGMEQSEQDKLFQKFSQVSAADGVKRAGTGLGLHSCKQIIDAHGGEIGCKSEPGKGSCFWFTIPVDATDAQLESAVPTKERISPNKHNGHASIISKFAILLLLFLGMQCLVFVGLRGDLEESVKRAQDYVAETNILFDSQELYALFLLWGKQTEVAIRKFDFIAARSTIPLLKEQVAKSRQILEKLEPGSAVARELTGILELQKGLVSLSEYTFQHLDELRGRMSDLVTLVTAAFKRGYDLEARVDRLISLENENVQTSFDWLKKLNFQILVTLLAAGVGDFIIIAAAAYTGLRIVERISVLKSKSDAFGLGEHITASLSGNDELSHLDGRLCQISSALHEAETERQELLAVINHDLATPLTSVLGTLELLGQGFAGELGETYARVVADSEHELERMISGVRNLLTIEKIDAGKLRLDNKRLRISEIVDETLNSVSRELEAKGALLSFEPEGRLGETEIYGDKELLVRLCTNVLSNAIEASPRGEKVTLSLRQDKDLIVASIEDHGPGITPELLPEIFERFRFLDDKPITGLGLPLAQRLCHLHGGSIQVKSSGPTGTKIEITLPREHTQAERISNSSS